jgi:hypothetical protein
MKIKELDAMINQVLEQEAKKLIMEQISETDHMIDAVKNFQTLSPLLDKISNIENIGNGKFGVLISIDNITPEELVDCCGGSSLEEAETSLMQGLHHDLEDNQIGNAMDVDIDTQGDENSLELKIKITAIKNTSQGDTEMNEKKEVILGDKEICQKCNKEVCECNNEVKEIEVDEEAKKWIQKAFNKIEKKGTEGKCTGKKYGSSTCPPGSKAYNMAKTLRKINETTMKKTITLTTAGMAGLLKKIINEVTAPKMDATTAKAIKDSGDQNNDALKAVEKKIKDYLTFKGNDNPEFPHQIGGEKVARQNSKEEDEVVDDNRGGTPSDLVYDHEPSEDFKKRAEMALVGDSKMGNPSDAVNAIKTDVGNKMVKRGKRAQELRRKEPIYKKSAVPVDEKSGNEPERGLKNPVVGKEIERMKQMSSYNKKTQ